MQDTEFAFRHRMHGRRRSRASSVFVAHCFVGAYGGLQPEAGYSVSHRRALDRTGPSRITGTNLNLEAAKPMIYKPPSPVYKHCHFRTRLQMYNTTSP